VDVDVQLLLERVIVAGERPGEGILLARAGLHQLEHLRQLREPGGVADQQVVDQRPGLGVEHALADALVIVLRAMVDGEQLPQGDELVLLQPADVVDDRLSHARLAVHQVEGAVVLGQALVEPQRQMGEVVVQEVVHVLVADAVQGVGARVAVDRHVVAPGAAREVAGDLDALALEVEAVGEEREAVLEHVHVGRARRGHRQARNQVRHP